MGRKGVHYCIFHQFFKIPLLISRSIDFMLFFHQIVFIRDTANCVEYFFAPFGGIFGPFWGIFGQFGGIFSVFLAIFSLWSKNIEQICHVRYQSRGFIGLEYFLPHLGAFFCPFEGHFWPIWGHFWPKMGVGNGKKLKKWPQMVPSKKYTKTLHKSSLLLKNQSFSSY